MRFIILLGVAVVETLWAQAPYVKFTGYPVPPFSDGSRPFGGGPYGIISGADGALWLQGSIDQLVRLTTEGAVTSYPVVAIGHRWGSGIMTGGPDGAIWFTLFGVNRIGRITSGGELAQYEIPLPAGAITTGSDGALWFTEGNRIGRLTTTGEVSEFSLPNAESCAVAMALGADGAVWFIESSACGSVVNGTTTVNSIGRIAGDGTITEYALPGSTFQGAWYIVSGPDGAMWFNEYYKAQIGQITLDGIVTEYPLWGPSHASNGAGPTSITAGPDGALWFPESNDDYFTHTLGRITTDGVITEFDVPALNINYSSAITTGPDGALWFTDGWTSNVIRAAPRPDFAIASGLLPPGRTGNTYSATLVAHGGTMPYTWTIAGGSLPEGLRLNPVMGVIAGTPASAGVADFTVQVTDSGSPVQSAEQALRISVAQ